MKVVPIALSKIHLSSFNPPSRTTESALRALKEDIATVGILSPVHVIPVKDRSFALVDGHRRVACALELGLTTVPAIVHGISASPVALWAALNSKTRSVNAFEWMVAWFLSDRELKTPPVVQGAINRCLQIFGENDFPMLIEYGASPSTLVKAIDGLHASFERASLLDKKMTRKTIGRWLTRHKLTSQVAQLMRIAPNTNMLRKVKTKLMRDQPFNARTVVMGRKAA